MNKTLPYFFSLLLGFFLLMPGFSQEEPAIEKVRVKGPRFGFDLSRLTLYYFEPERTAYEFSADIEVSRNYYPVVEFGIQEINIEKSIYNYQSEGYFFRFGLDYNFQQNLEIDQYEMVFFGFRYGFSKQNHSADNVIIEDEYWGDFIAGSVPESAFYGHWLELSGGIRAELFKNFFVGWVIRGKLLLVKSKHSNMEAYYIPGYGKGNKRLSLGFTYSVYYKFPLFKSRPKIKLVK